MKRELFEEVVNTVYIHRPLPLHLEMEFEWELDQKEVIKSKVIYKSRG